MQTPDELTPFVNSLRSLTPQPTAINRDALLFAAGQASHPRGWKWPLATGLFASLSIGLAAWSLVPKEPIIQTVTVPQVIYVDRVIEVKVPTSETVAHFVEPTTPDDGPNIDEARQMWKVRQEVFRWGVDMLPRPQGGGSTNQPIRKFESTPSTFAFPSSLFPKMKPAHSLEVDNP